MKRIPEERLELAREERELVERLAQSPGFQG